MRMLQRIIRDIVNKKTHEAVSSALIDQLYGKIHQKYYDDLMMKEANSELANSWIANGNDHVFNNFDAKSKSLLLNKNQFSGMN